jgi:hypothetical protein
MCFMISFPEPFPPKVSLLSSRSLFFAQYSSFTSTTVHFEEDVFNVQIRIRSLFVQYFFMIINNMIFNLET